MSSGERKRRSPNRTKSGVVGPPAKMICTVRRIPWEGDPQRVRDPYPKADAGIEAAPEYGGARGILPESSGTIPKG